MATDQWGSLTALLQGAQTALEDQQEPELLSLAHQLKQVSLAVKSCHNKQSLLFVECVLG